jgi:hypothetical protein
MSQRTTTWCTSRFIPTSAATIAMPFQNFMPLTYRQYPIANTQYPIANIQYPISNRQYPISNRQL